MVCVRQGDFLKRQSDLNLSLTTFDSLPLTMSDLKEAVDDFTHDIAIEISRALNITNPNDLLAKRVIQQAKNNKFDKFADGMHCMSSIKEKANPLTTRYSFQHARRLVDSSESSC